jgi:GT2 family glycosyltransferase
MSRKQKRIQSKQAILDVVITTAGRFDCLEKCLNALYREAQVTPLSIYVMDIDSPAAERSQNNHLFVYDPSKDVSRNVVNFQTKRFTQNVGFPTAANEGARMGRSPLIMILNDDVELTDGAIHEVIRSMMDETVGIVGIKLLFPQGTPNGPAGKVQHIGMSLNIRGEPVHPLIGWSPENPKTRVSRDVWAVTGACLTVRRTLFQQLKGFDLAYGKGTWEDADLCLRARQLGKRVYLNAIALGYHYTGASQEKRKEGFPLQQNMQFFHARWGPSGMMIADEFTYY